MYGHRHGAIAAGAGVGQMVRGPGAGVNARCRFEVGEMVADWCFFTSRRKEKIAFDRNSVTSLILFSFTRHSERTGPVTSVNNVVKGEGVPGKRVRLKPDIQDTKAYCI